MAAATLTNTGAQGPKPKPIEVKVDRPFVYAIQHVPSGACSSLGRLTDPRWFAPLPNRRNFSPASDPRFGEDKWDETELVPPFV